MSGTTANGWPYVTPDDHPKEFSAASQALAQKLENDLGGDSGWSGAGIVFGNGFTAYTSASWASPEYRRIGDIVYVRGAVQRGTPWAAGDVPLNIPAPFRPSARWLGQGVDISPNGDCALTGSGTGAVGFSLCYPLG